VELLKNKKKVVAGADFNNFIFILRSFNFCADLAAGAVYLYFVLVLNAQNVKLSIIVPVYNEKNTILEILKRLADLDLGIIEKEIIIVDDCSKDGTKDIVKSLGDNYKIIFHELNQGKGAAIRTGLKEATGDYVVIQDADLEYNPNDLKTMVDKMAAENLDVLYGSRRLNKENIQHSGFQYYLGGLVLTVLTNFLYGQKLTDEPTCYKMFKTELIKAMPLVCRRFEFCPEVTALISLSGYKIKEIPISYFPRHKKEGKKIGWHDAFVAILVLLKYKINSFLS